MNHRSFSQTGSVLVMVLWILMVISFLASGYVAHNRNKAGLAMNAMERLQQKAAAGSVLELLAAGKYDFLKQKRDEALTEFLEENGKPVWTGFAPGGVRLFARVEKSSSRTTLSLKNQGAIRSALRSMYGDEREDEADQLTDALLDWLDEDDLVRLNGAEKEYYNEETPFYNPGNGPFKTMAELFMVKGVSAPLFWGDPMATLNHTTETSSSESGSDSQGETGYAVLDDSENPKSLLDSFTIYSKNDTRVSVLFPVDDHRTDCHLFFVKKGKESLDITEHLHGVIPSPQ